MFEAKFSPPGLLRGEDSTSCNTGEEQGWRPEWKKLALLLGRDAAAPHPAALPAVRTSRHAPAVVPPFCGALWVTLGCLSDLQALCRRGKMLVQPSAAPPALFGSSGLARDSSLVS